MVIWLVLRLWLPGITFVICITVYSSPPPPHRPVPSRMNYVYTPPQVSLFSSRR